MTDQERRNLAEQLKANPLTDIILAEIETGAIERLVHAATEQDRIAAQAAVRAARAFRDALTSSVNTHRGRGAPV